jgi:uncharacterized protein (TIGR02646 family)
MITLTRVRTDPPVHKNFYGEKRLRANFELLRMKRDGELEQGSENKWNSAFWKEAKNQLLVETSGKCAYCETPTSVVAYGDVEHFRPKSIYWWLAYCYDNYLASCTICNQKYKGDKFALADPTKRWQEPVVKSNFSDEALKKLAEKMTSDAVNAVDGMSYEEFNRLHTEEGALLVHPYFENPEIYFAYRPILSAQEVHVVPAKPQYEDVVKAAEEMFGVNRTELLDLRFQWYSLYMTFRHTLADQSISQNVRTMNQLRLDAMLIGSQPYTGMVRYFQNQQLADLPWRFDMLVEPQLFRRV